MNKRTLAVVIAVLVIVVIAILVKNRSAGPASAPVSAIETAEPVTPGTLSQQEPVKAPEISPAPDVTEPDTAETSAPPAQAATASPPIEPTRRQPTTADTPLVLKGPSFSVRSDLVLARVNNMKITLKNLVPIHQSEVVEETMAATNFQALLQRAIDREVIMHTARMRNVQLDEDQRRIVEKARLSAGAKGFSLPDEERPAYEARSNFESVDLLATLFAEGIAKQSGAPEKDEVPEEEYQNFMRSMLDDLGQKAGVRLMVTVEP
jgi:hypothetical protein